MRIGLRDNIRDPVAGMEVAIGFTSLRAKVSGISLPNKLPKIANFQKSSKMNLLYLSQPLITKSQVRIIRCRLETAK
jgi:hypothetical protein